MARRNWIIDARDYNYDENAFRDAVVDELARAEHFAFRLGFGLVVAPIRQRLEDGSTVTLGMSFKAVTVPVIGGAPIDSGPLPDVWISFPNPEQQQPEPEEHSDDLDLEPQPEPEDFPEPAAVGKPDDPYAT